MAVVLIRVRRFDLGFATKSVILLFALSVALILATSGSNYLLGFVASLCVQALCWMLLVFAAKQCSGCELPLFCIGWIAQLAGGMCAMLLFSSVAGWETVALFVLLFAMALAVAFVFADKRFIVALDDEAEDEESARAEAGLGAEGVRASDCEKDAVAAKEEDEVGRIDCFCECYGLTAREHEVFALWIAGRDMRYIQEELVVAQGTVKSHIRNIYEKCDVHNRHDLVRKFESFE